MTDAGHVRIRNRLYEAFITAPFKPLQKDIVHAIVRLSMGWQRRTVVVSHTELAALVGLATVSGGFRSAIRELVREGVLLVGSTDGGSEANGYALNENYEQWGRFSQAEAKLDALWGRRPAHFDEQLPLGLLTLSRSAHPDSGESPPLTQASQGPWLSRVTPPDSGESGSRGVSVSSAASSGRGKTVKDNEIQPQRLGRADAMELLTRVDELREQVGDPKRTIIRRDRIRSAVGADVDEALRMCGGVDRLLKTKPEHHGILIGDFLVALQRVRGQAAKASA